MRNKPSQATYRNLKLVIKSGKYDYDDMCDKLDFFLMMGRITEEQYLELINMMPVPEEPEEPEESEEPEEPTQDQTSNS